MAFEQLEQHVIDLGGVKRRDGEALRPLDDAQQRELAALIDAPLPAALRWWWSRFGGGLDFVEPIAYRHPRSKEDIEVGWFLEAAEVRQALDDYSGSLAPHRIPIINDGGDNLIVVDTDGSVYDHIHDAPLDRNTYRIADSFEQFVLSLHLGD